MNPIDLLFVAIACGAFAWSMARYAPKAVPGIGLAAQGVLGVYTGLMVRDISFAALGSHWPIVVAVAVSTLVLSVAGGALLGLHRDITPLTGGLALVAGGSAGLVAIARELGGDDRVVAAVQYLRVALITAAMPVVATAFYHSTPSHAAQVTESGSLPWYVTLPLIASIVLVGAVAGRRLRLPGGGLIGPMVITIGLEFAGLAKGLAVPMLLFQAGIVLIVLQTVLALDRESLRAIRRILPGAFALIMVLNVAAAGLGVVLAHSAGLSMLDGYLATSPGGVYAVLGTAAGSGSNVTFVMASQVIRVVLMLVAAPFVAKMFIRFTPHRAPAARVRPELVPVTA
ncbi:AbrB family transcriptional regulator [Mycobacterium sp. TY814]|uniref:AbrB family transcriptional regulator n=1 Tax=unclassified Mycobacterium TaxID=2642494 RepID=UPI00274129C1|nr:AbrB family transcriptional regulator [Mycobacterium sp. TY814]MDP7722783.1 AbrB family transcriptional regulator [Mycobacterium sp. TY814]